MCRVVIVGVFVVLFGCVIEAPNTDEPLMLTPTGQMNQDPVPGQSDGQVGVSGPQTVSPSEPIESSSLIESADAASGCQLEMSWAKTSPNIFAHATWSAGGLQDLMPNHPMVIGSSVKDIEPFDDVSLMAYRLEDGEPVFEVDYEHLSGALDENWYTKAEIQHDNHQAYLIVRPILDAPEFWRREIQSDGFNHVVQFTPNGQSVILVSCEQDRRTDDFMPSMGTTIKKFGVTDGELESTVSIPDYCANNLLHQPAIAAISPDGRHLLLASNERFWRSYDPNSILRVDLQAEVYQRIEPLDDPVALLDLKLNPDGNQLFATTLDGVMRRWSFPALRPLTDFGSVGVFGLGRRTYMPSDDSPFAFSRTGRHIAYIDADMDVVIAQVSNGEIKHRVDLTRFLNDDLMPNGNTGAEAAELAFTEDGAGLVIGLTSGLAAYRCAGVSFPRGRDNLSVLIDAPPFADVGETVSLTATHVDATHMHGHAFFVTGALLAQPSTSRYAEWLPEASGVYEITVRLIDGVNTGEATTFIEVFDP